MAIRLNPYINFASSAREALDFYKSVFGGELQIMTYADQGMAHNPVDNDKIMHGQLETPNGLTLMASDAPSDMPLDKGSTISVSLSGDEEATMRGYWDKLAEGANITMPIEKAPWGDTFGMLTDRFGVAWMVNITGQR